MGKTTYNELREEAARDRQEKLNNPQYRSTTTVYGREIAGQRFTLRTLRQSYNSANAIQVLHYVGGEKVNKAEFIARLEGRQAIAG